MVTAAAPALFVKQMSDRICDTEKKIIEHLIASVCVKGLIYRGSQPTGLLWL